MIPAGTLPGGERHRTGPSPTTNGSKRRRREAITWRDPRHRAAGPTPPCVRIRRTFDELNAKGIDTGACIAVNDSWVMHAWGADQNARDIQMVADGNAEFANAMGLEMDGSSFGLGTRSQRYAAIIEDGVVKQLLVEPGPGVEASSAENVLANV